MGLFGKLFGGPRQKLVHATFGQCLFFDSYWEAEDQVDGHTIAVIIEGADAGPTDSQAAFYRKTIGDLDSLFARIAPILRPEYETWVGSPLPDDCRTAFSFAGITVPRNGADDEPLDVSYDCLTDPAGHQFTVYFERGRPTSVTIDG